MQKATIFASDNIEDFEEQDKNMGKKRVGVFYGRFSPGANQTENSITGQRRCCYAAAKRDNVPLLHDYIDRAITGKTDKRPQFLQMIKDAERGQFNCVYVYKTDRFSRDKYDLAVYKHKLKKLGVRVISATENIPEGPEGIILESVLEGLAQYYSAELSQKVARGQYDRAREYRCVGGPIPFGYKLSEDKHFMIDEDKAPIVKEIFIRYSKGETAELICSDLNSRGLKTQKNGDFNKCSLHRMFKNKKYIGIYEFKDIYAENVIPKIIEKELFEKVGVRVKKNKRQTAKINTNSPKFKLTGKIFCGDCKSTMAGDSGTSATGKTYYSYCCVNKKLKKACIRKNVPKDWLETKVVEVTKDNVLKGDVINFISDCVVRLQAEQKDDSMVMALNNQLSGVKQSLNNLLKAIEKGIFSETTQNRMVNLEKQKKELEDSIEIEKFKINAPKIKKEQVIFWLEKFKNGNIEDQEYQQQIIDTFISSILLYDDKMVIAYNYSGDNDTVEVNIRDDSEYSSESSLKVEDRRFELLTPCVQSRCSTS